MATLEIMAVFIFLCVYRNRKRSLDTKGRPTLGHSGRMLGI